MAKIVHEAKSNVFNEQPPEVLNFIHSLIQNAYDRTLKQDSANAYQPP